MKPEFLFLNQEYGCDSKDGECSWLNDKGDTQVTLTIRSREPISLSRYALKSGATKDKRDPASSGQVRGELGCITRALQFPRPFASRCVVK